MDAEWMEDMDYERTAIGTAATPGNFVDMGHWSAEETAAAADHNGAKLGDSRAVKRRLNVRPGLANNGWAVFEMNTPELLQHSFTANNLETNPATGVVTSSSRFIAIYRAQRFRS